MVVQYALPQDFKAYPHGVNLKTFSEVELDPILQMASEWVDNECGHGPGGFAVTVATALPFDGNGKSLMMTPFAVAYQSLVINGSTIPTTNWLGYPSNPIIPFYQIGLVPADQGVASYTVMSYPGAVPVFSRGRQNVVITATWGYSATPPVGIKQATILIAAEFIKGQGSQSFAIGGGSAGQNPTKHSRNDQFIDNILNNYRRIVPL